MAPDSFFTFLLSVVVFSAARLTLSYGLPHSSETEPDSGLVEALKAGTKSTKASESGENQSGPSPAVVARQEEEDDDDSDDRQKIVKNIGTILLGSFSLNPVKILKGAFGFAEDDLQKHIFNPLLKLPEALSKTRTTLKPGLASEVKWNSTGKRNHTLVDSTFSHVAFPQGPVFPPPSKVKLGRTTANPEDDEDEELNV